MTPPLVAVEECETCGRERGERHQATVATPDLIDIMRDSEDYGTCEATDGCTVEPDGTCPHGHQSWMIILGVI